MSNELLTLFATLDAAYNRRDWQTYSDLLDDAFQGHSSKGGPAEGKADHVENARRVCQVFGNCQVHHEPYKVAVADGEWTCTVARFTGEMTGAFHAPSGRSIPPTHHTFDIAIATFARWRLGKIIEEYGFADQAELLRQVGITEIERKTTKES